ncbi:MAG: AraC family transcriptional regulator [Pseudomonadota bacterium]
MPSTHRNPQFHLDYFDPPEGLEKYILTTFDIQWNEEVVQGRHLGAMGQLFLAVSGRGYVQFGDRKDWVDGRPMLFNAFEVATPYKMQGPYRNIGASLSPYGWAALTQAPLDKYGNRLLAASDWLGEEVNQMSDDIVSRCQSGVLAGEQACHELAKWIGARLQALPEAHEAVIDRVFGWLSISLNPPIEELFEDTDYSRRQIERLVGRYFGFTPKGLARKFRAIRAANLLAQPDLTDEGEAEIADAFHDQSHMIREFRRFCGFTPTQIKGLDDRMFKRLTYVQNLDRLKGFRSIG